MALPQIPHAAHLELSGSPTNLQKFYSYAQTYGSPYRSNPRSEQGIRVLWGSLE